MNEAATIGLRSVNVALPAYLCQRHGEMIASGIRKQPVATSTVYVSPTNIDGDGQGDLVAHGGVEKAVYAYPSEHWLPWTEEIGPSEPYGAGSFGENLSLTGLCEDEACIGDIWSWGDVRLQICQPRYPCYKLGVVLGYPKVVAMMVRNGRTGWYLRVLTAGEAPTSGAIELNRVIPRGHRRASTFGASSRCRSRPSSNASSPSMPSPHVSNAIFVKTCRRVLRLQQTEVHDFRV